MLIPAVAGAAVAAGVGAVIGTGIVATIAAGIAGAVVATGVSRVMGLGKQPSAPPSTFDGINRGALVNSAGTIDQIPIIYGSRRVGATRLFTEASGAANETLHLVFAHCEGEISAINTVYLDDVASGDSRFSGLVTLEKHTGTDDQAASAALMAALPSSWTSAHRGRGVAYTYAQLTWNQDAFNGLPVITADIDGKLLYDPRVAGSPSYVAFSNNPALAILDYLTSTRYGRGVPLSAVDTTSFGNAADHCDEMVAVPATGSPSFNFQKRYTCDGIVNPDAGTLDNMRALLTACRGSLVYSGGFYKLVLDKATTASTFGFDEDNIIGEWQIRPAGKRDKVNRIRCRFFNPDRQWQPDIAVVDSPTYRTEDNGLLLERELDLPFTADLYRAQQIAQIDLKQSRIGMTCTFRAAPEGMRCEVGDVVPITHSTPGWDGKLFRIVNLNLLPDGEVRVTAREYDATVYDLDSLSLVNAAPSTNLPDPFTCAAPTGLTFAQSASVWDTGLLTWTASADTFVSAYQLEYKLASDSAWTVLPLVRDAAFAIPKLAPRSYDFRVKAINTLGVSSSYATLSASMEGQKSFPYGSGSAVGLVRKTTDITVGLDPEGMDWAPTSGLVFVACNGSSRVDVINPQNDEKIASIDIDLPPQKVTYCPTDDRLYVSGRGGSPTEQRMYVVNPVTFEVESSFDLVSLTVHVGNGVWCPSTGEMFFSIGTGNLMVLNPLGSPANDAALFAVGGLPNAPLCYCPSNDRIYAVSSFNVPCTVRVINPQTRAEVASINVGQSPQGICYCPENDRIYVCNRANDSISVINPATNTVVATLSFGSPSSLTGFNDIEFSTASRLLYVVRQTGLGVLVLRPSDNTFIAEAEVDTSPDQLLWVPTASKLYISHDGAASTTVSAVGV